MNLVDVFTKFEEEQEVLEEVCEKCENYRNGFDGPYCMLHGMEPCITTCDAFEFSEFWKTKRGY